VRGAEGWSGAEGEVVAKGALASCSGRRLDRLKSFLDASVAKASNDRGRLSLGRDSEGPPSGERGASCAALKYAIDDCLRADDGRVESEATEGDLIGE
jgi:hypothetical protein